MTQIRLFTLTALCATLIFTLQTVRAEEAKPKEEAPKADANTRGGGERGRGGDPRGGGDRGRGNWGGMGGAGFGGFGGLGATAGTRGANSSVYSVAARSLGVDIQDPKSVGSVENLPLGQNKQMVTQIPIGGVDNLKVNSKGWNMENVFTMTAEQIKTVEALREEYALEEKKLEKEIAEQEKALAAKSVALRLQFEKRANDLLAGADKESKEKLDALAAEVHKKQNDLVAESLPLYDLTDMTQGFAMIRALSDKTTKITKEGELKLLELIPEYSKDKIQTLIKAQADARERMNRFTQAIGGERGAERGERGGGKNDAVKPPKPPDTTENKF